MNIQHRRLALISILSLAIFLGCILAPTVGKVYLPPDLPETLAAQTWSAMQTSAALSATATFTSVP